MAFKKGEPRQPGPGRPKGGKEKDPTPPELRRFLAKIKQAQPQALDIMIEAMVKTLPDGTVLKDTKIAEKVITLYFQALKMSEDLKARNKKESEGNEGGKPAEPSKPKFSLEVVNPSTGKLVGVKTE